MKGLLLSILVLISCVSKIFSTEITKFGTCPDASSLTRADKFDFKTLDGFYPVVAYYRQDEQTANTCFRMRFTRNTDDETRLELRWRDPLIYVPGVPAGIDLSLRTTGTTGLLAMYTKGLFSTYWGAMYVLNAAEDNIVLYTCRAGLFGTYLYDVLVLNPKDKFTYTDTQKAEVDKILAANHLEQSVLQRVNQNPDFCNRVMDP